MRDTLPPTPPSRATMPCLAVVGLLMSNSALAGYPDDVSLSQLESWNGEAFTDSSTLGFAYSAVVKQLAVGIANKPLTPAETLGVHGFDVAFTSGITFIDAHSDESSEPAPWQRVHPEGDPTRVMWVPGLTARKGLPFSLEMGANLGYIAFSNQTVFGAYGRWAFLEGYRDFPDVSAQLGYSGYIGNDELDLGVMDASMSVGYTVPFGHLAGISSATISPYIGAGVMVITASPILSESAMNDLGIAPVSGFPKSENNAEGYVPPALHAGFRLLSGDVQFSLATTIALRVAVTMDGAIGFVF